MKVLKVKDIVKFSDHYNFIYPKNNTQYIISKVIEKLVPYKAIPNEDKTNYFLAYGKLDEYPLITYHIKDLDTKGKFPYYIVSQFGIIKV